MAIIQRVGNPENDSENKAIRRLGKGLDDNFVLFHNFELTTGHGLPYEYDIAVLAPHALYHVEVKGYQGEIRGNISQCVFENGSVYPSPIPLANKKTKILANKIRQHHRQLDEVFVETLILLTDDRSRVRIRDDQAGRIHQEIRMQERTLTHYGRDCLKGAQPSCPWISIHSASALAGYRISLDFHGS